MKALRSGNSNSTRALDLDSPGGGGEGVGQGRHTLQKHHPSVEESFMGRKRFSKRQSKSGLAAVF